MASRMTGAKGVNRALNDIPKGLDTPIGQASRKALRPTLAAAKANLKEHGNVRSGKLLKLLTILKDKNAPKDRVRYDVGPSSKDPAYREAHLVEFGTAPHRIGKGMHPGARAFPFLRPAFEATKDKIIAIFGREIGPAIEKRAAQVAAKRKK